jgi:uncharacterized membrane protein
VVILEMGSQKLFAVASLELQSSQNARITGMSYWYHLREESFTKFNICSDFLFFLGMRVVIIVLRQGLATYPSLALNY